MAKVSVKINVRTYIYDIDSYPKTVKDAVSKTFEYYLDMMKNYARNHHRFSSRTGNLVAAIENKMRYLTGEVYIDDLLAPYGVYVHNGQRSWRPDPFITRAFNAKESGMENALLKTLEKTYLKYEKEKIQR